jgi:hypothetical protein
MTLKGPEGPKGPAGPGTPSNPVAVAIVAVVNEMANLGIRPRGFVGMVVTLLGTLAGVYAQAGDGR